jgi:glycosyltransferase involved in cell wall biosynthesis
MKLHVITIAYDRPVGLRGLIDSFILQSNPDWDMIVFHDGPASFSVRQTASLYENDKRVSFVETSGRQGNWGHANRKAGLQMLMGEPGDFVLITNDDNYYIPRFVEYMFDIASQGNVGMVYCDFLHHTLNYINMISQPKLNYIDMGAFIVDLALAQEVGFNHDVAGADGLFAEECNAKCIERGLRSVHIEKTLFIHN